VVGEARRELPGIEREDVVRARRRGAALDVVEESRCREQSSDGLRDRIARDVRRRGVADVERDVFVIERTPERELAEFPHERLEARAIDARARANTDEARDARRRLRRLLAELHRDLKRDIGVLLLLRLVEPPEAAVLLRRRGDELVGGHRLREGQYRLQDLVRLRGHCRVEEIAERGDVLVSREAGERHRALFAERRRVGSGVLGRVYALVAARVRARLVRACCEREGADRDQAQDARDSHGGRPSQGACRSVERLRGRHRTPRFSGNARGEAGSGSKHGSKHVSIGARTLQRKSSVTLSTR